MESNIFSKLSRFLKRSQNQNINTPRKIQNIHHGVVFIHLKTQFFFGCKWFAAKPAGRCGRLNENIEY